MARDASPAERRDHRPAPRASPSGSTGTPGRIMVLPAVIVLLAFAIFPLIISAYLSLSRFALAPRRLHAELRRPLQLQEAALRLAAIPPPRHLRPFGPVAWLLLALVARPLACCSCAPLLPRPLHRCSASIGRLITAGAGDRRLLWSLATDRSPAASPAPLVNTLIYVVVGVTVQFAARPRPRAPLRPADPRRGTSSACSSSCR